MELFNTIDDESEILYKYKSDIVEKDNIKDIVEYFDLNNQNVHSIHLSNSESYPDAFHMRYENFDDFKISCDYKDNYVSSATFNCSTDSMNYSVVLDLLASTIGIWQKKRNVVDFLPFLTEMEEQIKLKKNSGLKM